MDFTILIPMASAVMLLVSVGYANAAQCDSLP
jgi:hypothetical protein